MDKMGDNTGKFIMRWLLFIIFSIVLSGCSTMKRHDGAPDYYVDESKIPNAVPKVEPLAKNGNMPSYVVFGKRYYTMKSSKNYEAVGTASWYGTLFHSRSTSSGEPYDMLGMTAAHKTLPLPTYVEVTNLNNHRTIIVKVNDRGPFESNRIIDLSYVAAKKLGMLPHGTASVKIKAIDPSTWGKTDNMWLASNSESNSETQSSDNTDSPRPLKRTYTYYLTGDHHLGRGATVTTASAAPIRKVFSYPSYANHRTKTRALFADRRTIEKSFNNHARVARHGKSRTTYAQNIRGNKRIALHKATARNQSQAVYLQVGAFRSKQNAQRLRQRLTALLGTPVNVSRQAKHGKLYNVRVGPIRDVMTANKLSLRLQNLGIRSNKL